MKTIKIHKILTKQETDKWVIPFSWRMSDDVDPRDPDPTTIKSSMTEKQFFNIVIPYRQLTISYPGYIGYDRAYIDLNTLDIYSVFEVDDATDAVAFARQYLEAIGKSNPITLAWMNLIASVDAAPNYHVSFQVEDADNTIHNL